MDNINPKMSITVKLLIALLLTLVGSLCVFLVLAVYPYDVLRIDKIIVDREEVVPGDKICFVLQGEKFYDVAGKVLVELVNGEAIEIMKYEANNPPGRLSSPYRCFIWPKVLPGKWKIRWSAVYPMNAFNNRPEKILSDWITSLEKAPCKDGIAGPKRSKGDRITVKTGDLGIFEVTK